MLKTVTKLNKSVIFVENKNLNTMKERHYFKFVVSDNIEHHYNKFEQAQKKAKELDEKVYLAIFDSKNIYGEIYDEEIINSKSEIEAVKEKLLKSYSDLTTI